MLVEFKAACCESRKESIGGLLEDISRICLVLNHQELVEAFLEFQTIKIVDFLHTFCKIPYVAPG